MELQKRLRRQVSGIKEKESAGRYLLLVVYAPASETLALYRWRHPKIQTLFSLVFLTFRAF
jgi:hypothetical protein